VARRKKKLSPIFVVSLGVHLAAGAALALIPQERLREVVAIAMNEAPKPDKKPEPPKPPPREADRPAPHRSQPRAPRSASALQPAAAAANQANAFTDLGLTLDSSSSDGLAVNIAPSAAKPSAAVAAPAASLVKPKLLVARKAEPTCVEALAKARPLGVVRPSYTEEARRARIEGRVRVQLTVNELGEVTEARVLERLGYGLDEAAMVAAKSLRFAAATQCGRPVTAPFVIAMRFLLGT
jgi:protein TonB